MCYKMSEYKSDDCGGYIFSELGFCCHKIDFRKFESISDPFLKKHVEKIEYEIVPSIRLNYHHKPLEMRKYFFKLFNDTNTYILSADCESSYSAESEKWHTYIGDFKPKSVSWQEIKYEDLSKVDLDELETKLSTMDVLTAVMSLLLYKPDDNVDSGK